MRIKILVDSVYAQLSLGMTVIAMWCQVLGFFTYFWHEGPLVTSEFAGFSLKGYSGLWKGCEETGTLCFRPGGGSKWSYEIFTFLGTSKAILVFLIKKKHSRACFQYFTTLSRHFKLFFFIF